MATSSPERQLAQYFRSHFLRNIPGLAFGQNRVHTRYRRSYQVHTSKHVLLLVKWEMQVAEVPAPAFLVPSCRRMCLRLVTRGTRNTASLCSPSRSLLCRYSDSNTSTAATDGYQSR